MKRPKVIDGRLFLWNGTMLFLGTIVDTAVHKHHAVQMTIGLSGSFVLETDDVICTPSVVLIDSDYNHRLLGESGFQALLLVERENEMAERLRAVYLADRGLRMFDAEPLGQAPALLRRLLEGDPDMARAAEAVDALLAALAVPSTVLRHCDPRIERARAIIRNLDEKRIRVSDIAAELAMSETRLIHLFREETGIPIRRYLLWKRLLDSVRLVVRTGDITRAAHESGFFDSSHLARIFKDNFGTTISEIFKNDRFIQVCIDS